MLFASLLHPFHILSTLNLKFYMSESWLCVLTACLSYFAGDFDADQTIWLQPQQCDWELLMEVSLPHYTSWWHVSHVSHAAPSLPVQFMVWNNEKWRSNSPKKRAHNWQPRIANQPELVLTCVGTRNPSHESYYSMPLELLVLSTKLHWPALNTMKPCLECQPHFWLMEFWQIPAGKVIIIMEYIFFSILLLPMKCSTPDMNNSV